MCNTKFYLCFIKVAIKMENTKTRLTVRIDDAELQEYREYFKMYGTKKRCLEYTNIAFLTLQNVLLFGKCDTSTLELIRSYFQSIKAS